MSRNSKRWGEAVAAIVSATPTETPAAEPFIPGTVPPLDRSAALEAILELRQRVRSAELEAADKHTAYTDAKKRAEALQQCLSELEDDCTIRIRGAYTGMPLPPLER